MYSTLLTVVSLINPPHEAYNLRVQAQIGRETGRPASRHLYYHVSLFLAIL
jgi:hypothetical protein